MGKSKGLRLAATHKLQALADTLSSSNRFRSGEIKMLLLIHQHIETLGPIDRHRFREILIILFAITDDVMLDLVFSAFDKNNDTFIDNLEWVSGLSVMLRGSLEQLTDFTYKVYDINGDGGLSREELHHCLKGCMYAGFGLDDDDMDDSEQDIVDIAMKKLDNDGDGQITYQDFVRCVNVDALMLQAIGQCLPSPKFSAGFQSLVSDNYHQSSALLPKRREIIKKKKKGSDTEIFAEASAMITPLAPSEVPDIPATTKLPNPNAKRVSIEYSPSIDQINDMKAKRLHGSLLVNRKSYSYIKNVKTLALALAIRDQMNLRAMQNYASRRK